MVSEFVLLSAKNGDCVVDVVSAVAGVTVISTSGTTTVVLVLVLGVGLISGGSVSSGFGIVPYFLVTKILKRLIQ